MLTAQSWSCVLNEPRTRPGAYAGRPFGGGEGKKFITCDSEKVY